MRFEGKSGLVTGAGKGIGKAIAMRLAADGAKVLCADVDQQALDDVVSEIEAAGGAASTMCVDVSDAAQVEAMVSKAIESFGNLHLAVNNAGIGGAGKPLAEKTPTVVPLLVRQRGNR